MMQWFVEKNNQVVMRMLYITDEFVSVNQATSCLLCSCGKLLPDVDKNAIPVVPFFSRNFVLICVF